MDELQPNDMHPLGPILSCSTPVVGGFLSRKDVPSGNVVFLCIDSVSLDL